MWVYLMGLSSYGPVHLGLIDRPFVHHNLISALESSAPLPTFQMAPYLKSKYPVGQRKEPRYTFLFFQTVPASKFLPDSPMGPYGERYTLTGHFYMSLDISLYLKGSERSLSLYVPQKRGPYGNKIHTPDPYLTYLPGYQVKEPCLQDPLTDSYPVRRARLYSSFKVLSIRAPLLVPQGDH
jgi:hypothetical protein